MWKHWISARFIWWRSGSLVGGYQCFQGSYFLHLRDKKLRQYVPPKHGTHLPDNMMSWHKKPQYEFSMPWNLHFFHSARLQLAAWSAGCITEGTTHQIFKFLWTHIIKLYLCFRHLHAPQLNHYTTTRNLKSAREVMQTETCSTGGKPNTLHWPGEYIHSFKLNVKLCTWGEPDVKFDHGLKNPVIHDDSKFWHANWN